MGAWPLLLLLALTTLAVQHSPPLHLKSKIILTGQHPLTFDTRLVSATSWSSARQPAVTESSLVSCGHTCARRNREEPGSCNALMFSKETRDCYLGTATLAGGQEQSELVYLTHGTGAGAGAGAGFPELLHTDASHKYWAVPVEQGVVMVEGATTAVCREHSMQAVCWGPSGCQHNDESMCVVTPLETACFRLMDQLSQAICNGEINAHKCPKLEGVFHYRRNTVGDIGVVEGTFVDGRDYISGQNGKIIYAYCASLL